VNTLLSTTSPTALHLHNDKPQTSTRSFLQLTSDEAKTLSGHVLFVDRYGDVRKAKVTSVKTWKTRPGCVEVHLKYGLYEYFTATYTNGQPVHEQLVREVEAA
jgi:hypothetical protein